MDLRKKQMLLEYMKDYEYLTRAVSLKKIKAMIDKKWNAFLANLNQHFCNQGVSISLEPCHKLDRCATYSFKILYLFLALKFVISLWPSASYLLLLLQWPLRIELPLFSIF